MSKRTTFRTVTPLPASITRDIALSFLHDHQEMIDLNPLVVERHPISPPPHAEPEEQACTWYSITDKIAYVPGVVSSKVTYTGAFHDLPDGLQTHCHAPMGLELRSRWSVGGNLPGEPRAPIELGLGAPETGLYLREDVEMRCNIMMTGFVKKTIKRGHGKLVDRLAVRAVLLAKARAGQSPDSPSGQLVLSNSSTQSIRRRPTPHDLATSELESDVPVEVEGNKYAPQRLGAPTQSQSPPRTQPAPVPPQNRYVQELE